MFKKSPLKSAKLVKKKRRLLYVKIVLIILLVSGVIALLSYLSSLQLFAITNVVVKGNDSVDAQTIEDIAHTELQGKYYYLFSRANRFIYPDDTIQEKIYAHSLRIKTLLLEVEKNDLVIFIGEREPSYTWCPGMPTQRSNAACYFLDEEGYIFSEAPIFSGNAFFAFYGEVDNEKPLGATYLSASQFKDIDVLIEFLDSHQLHPFAFHSRGEGVYDIYLEQGGRIIFKEGDDVSVLMSNLQLVLEKTALFSTHASQLEYVDLRFGNKLFYKLKGDNAVPLENGADV